MSNQLLVSPIDKTIVKVCTDAVVKNYLKSCHVHGGVLYTCKKLSIFNTEYKINQFILLPESTNSSPSFGKIKSLLCDEKYGYLVYEKTTSYYCKKTDLFFININEDAKEEIILAHQLSELFHKEFKN